jgi:hypothetical protein
MGEWFTERKLIPLWRSDERKLNISLTPEFTSNPNISIEFDLTDVRALQEDEDAKYKRLQIAVGKPWMTRNEAREDTGQDAVANWDEEDLAEPKPVPEALKPFVEGTLQAEMSQDEAEDMQKDLSRWRVKSIKQLKAGKSAAVLFESNTIPESLNGAVFGALEGAKTQIDINRIFHNAMTWKGYP